MQRKFVRGLRSLSVAAQVLTPTLSLAAGLDAGNAPAPQLLKLSTTDYPSALCNDGTPGAIVMRLNPASTRWVIELQGGGECITVGQCRHRPSALTSSSGYLTGAQFAGAFQGILSADPVVNPTFATANQVLLPYCSGDLWTGAAVPTGSNEPFYFQGRSIVTAAIQTLLALPGGLAGATDVLLTGSSAGGVGVVIDANDILPLLPAGIATSIETDAGFINDFPAFSATSPPTYEASLPLTPDEAIYFVASPLWGGRGDNGCSQDPRQGYLCYNTAYLITNGYIPGPIFVSIAEQDVVQLADDGIGPLNNSQPAQVFTGEFAAEMQALLLGSGTGVSVFSPNARLHEQITTDQMYTLPTSFAGGTTTLSQAIGSWYAAPLSGVKNIQ